MTVALLQILVGFVLLIWSADRLVSGAAAVAYNHGIPTLLVGVMVVGFGTSAPELLVSAIASFKGNPSLAIGNALGSNIANVCLILGVTGIFYPLTMERSSLKREFPVLGLITVLTALLMLDSALSRTDGVILIAGLVAFVGGMSLWAVRKPNDAAADPAAEALVSEIPEQMPSRRAMVWIGVGLVVLPLSARILVDGAVDLATLLGISEAVVGLTIVALGTSLPELAAAIASAVRKEDDLCIGNILGSNVFNLLGVLGIAALVHPMIIEPILLVRDLPVMIASFLLVTVLAYTKQNINRFEALVLFAGYLAYQAFVITHALA